MVLMSVESCESFRRRKQGGQKHCPLYNDGTSFEEQ